MRRLNIITKLLRCDSAKLLFIRAESIVIASAFVLSLERNRVEIVRRRINGLLRLQFSQGKCTGMAVNVVLN
jgi:hypothetical protein